MKNVIKREQCKLACGLPSVNILSKVSKFKVLLYLKKSNLDKEGKAPIMGRITLNNSMAQFSCKLSCNPKLWNSRSGRLEGKSKEAVDGYCPTGFVAVLLHPQKTLKAIVMDRITYNMQHPLEERIIMFART